LNTRRQTFPLGILALLLGTMPWENYLCHF
jgi:hypothetical protein